MEQGEPLGLLRPASGISRVPRDDRNPPVVKTFTNRGRACATTGVIVEVIEDELPVMDIEGNGE